MLMPGPCCVRGCLCVRGKLCTTRQNQKGLTRCCQESGKLLPGRGPVFLARPWTVILVDPLRDLETLCLTRPHQSDTVLDSSIDLPISPSTTINLHQIHLYSYTVNQKGIA